VDDRGARNYLSGVEMALHKLGIGANNLHSDSFGIRDFSKEGRVTLSTVHKAKGNEAFMVYVVGADAVMFRPDVRKRNMLFTAMTRAKGLTYRQVYEECVKEFAYDFRLRDQSLMMFVKGGNNEHDGSLSYCYYEAPVAVMSYEEFVADQFRLTPLDAEYQEALLTVGDELRPDYEQCVVNMESKRYVTPIRYDYKASDYREGVHPASHVHFGFANEVRVGTRRILNPVSFVLLIVRQRYPRAWETVLKHRRAQYWCRNVREEIAEVNGAYWKALDLREMAFHQGSQQRAMLE
jgi:hypothetical protein